MELILETRAQQEDRTVIAGRMMFAPPVDEDYWLYRVKVGERQAVIGFPKFGSIGIGFAVEDADWNTNFPSSVDADVIYEHIKVNKGDEGISREDCLEAIGMIQEAVARGR
jgi:hypothetical protein